MQTAANIVDLASYRRKREVEAKVAAPQAMPIVFVPVWAYVPVFLVAGYH